MQRIQLTTPEGVCNLPVFEGADDMVASYRNKEIAEGDYIMYRGIICQVLNDQGEEIGPALLALQVVMKEVLFGGI